MAEAAPAERVLELPVWCGELDVAEVPALLPRPTRGARSYRLLVREHGEPLGYVQGPLEAGTSVEELFRRVRSELPPPAPAAPAERLRDVAQARRVTIAVCTRERPADLQRCLERLRAVRYRPLELLVVDNAPASRATRDVVARAAAHDARVRYVVEPRPGLSRARNRALAEASGEVLAFTDDDVHVDPWWVHGLVRGFDRRPDVGCVTGLVATAGIGTAPEAYFDRRVPWAHVRPHRLYDLDDQRLDDPMYPYAAGVFGTGANFALDTALMRRLGGFDEALGAGSPSRGGEDLDAFVRVLQAGRSISHEPAAVVWHHHRADVDGLRRQMYGYGSGLTAFYAKHLVDRRTRGQFLRSAPHGAARLARVGSASRSAASGSSAGAAVPAGAGPADGAVRARDLLVRELAGMAVGPLLYAAGRWRTGR
ncbi:glycosyltransferase family 2 protein [Kineococcus indalonis]|uniref:glycosyltransferase family 2 protein n=1 Tax=Kineococcus indalonis TaxID=2696566 RepID=UPI0014132A2B|nr:glycosyltransferase [Kineococcus indalonis]NAZ86488.1 glycosyltransferase [Kineococcus indalonis]